MSWPPACEDEIPEPEDRSKLEDVSKQRKENLD
jgi:hypothetical protein